jgi:hypothetical protein
LIASRFPPIELFERVSDDPAIWDALIEAEQLTNPRLRDEIGDIRLVPPDERVSGPNASWVMGAFTHVNPRGSRFSDGTCGVYYAAKAFETALRETAHHFGLLSQEARLGPRYEDFRVLVGAIRGDFHDIRLLPAARRRQLLDPSTTAYARSARWARALRDRGSNGIAYPSVRHEGGDCVAAFRPRVVRIPLQTKHVQLHWDGESVRRYFDYEVGVWVSLGA